MNLKHCKDALDLRRPNQHGVKLIFYDAMSTILYTNDVERFSVMSESKGFDLTD